MSEAINFVSCPHFKVLHEHQNATNAYSLPNIIPQPPIRLHQIKRNFENTTNIKTAFEQWKSSSFHLGWERQKEIPFPRFHCSNETLRYEIEINHMTFPNLTLQLHPRVNRIKETVNKT